MRRAAACVILAACRPEVLPMGESAESGATGTSTTMASVSSGVEPTSGGPTSPQTADGDGSSGGSTSTGTPPGDTTTGGSEGGTSTTTMGEAEPWLCCKAPPAPTVSVEAKTPIGMKTFEWAVYAVTGGECGGGRFLYLLEEPGQIEAGMEESIMGSFIKLTANLNDPMWSNGFVGTGAVIVEANIDGQLAVADGALTITEFDDSGREELCDPDMPVDITTHVKFEISLQQGDWDIQGQGMGYYCSDFSVFCP